MITIHYAITRSPPPVDHPRTTSDLHRVGWRGTQAQLSHSNITACREVSLLKRLNKQQHLGLYSQQKEIKALKQQLADALSKPKPATVKTFMEVNHARTA